MTKFRLLGLALLATVSLAACDDDDPEARLRAVHLSPDAPAVDVLVNGDRVLSNVPYTGASDYLTVDAGSNRVQVNAAGTSTTVIDANLDLDEDGDYTVIATDFLEDITPIVLEDDNSAPASGNVKVRLVHGAPSAPTVDIYVTAPGADISGIAPTLANVPFQAASDYLEVPAGSYQIRITVAGTKTVALDSGAVPLSAGQIRTVIARDDTDGNGGAPFGAVILEDRN